MKTIRRYHMHVILFFYLFSAYAGATHIHHDTFIVQDNCKVCVVAKNLHGNDITVAAPLLEEVNSLFDVISVSSEMVTTFLFKGFDSNAPPVFL